jgi:transglutaminase-like putative cysteine protease
MRIKIHHQTNYSYDAAPAYLVQRLLLYPAEFTGQRIVNWHISAPGMETGLKYIDGFGNVVHLLTAQSVSEQSMIIAAGEVETQDTGGVVKGLVSGAPPTVFLRQTTATQLNETLRDYAEQYRDGRPALERLHELNASLHETVSYEIGTSNAYTTAAEAFAARRGVCQDHAHIMVGIARYLGLPARYVTGYLVTGIGASSAAAHAWADIHVPDLGWVGFDAANGQSPTEQYVRTAIGLDADGATPIRGLRRGGGGAENMRVEVRVEIAQQ